MPHLLPTVDLLGGVACTRTLAEHGSTAREVDRAVARGDLVRLRQRWVALPTAPVPLVRAVRTGGRLSCVSVLSRHGIWCSESHGLHVRVDPRFHALSSPSDRCRPLSAEHGLTVHRTIPSALAESQLAADPIPHALLQAIRCQKPLDAIASIDSALNKMFVTLPEVESLLAALPVRCQRYRPRIDPKSQSGLETKARLSLRGMNIPYRSQVWIDGVGYVDLLIGERLVLEVDGFAFHSRKEDFENDRRRDVELARLDYRTLRASYSQVMVDWDRVFAVVRGLIAQGEHRWSATHG
ncbi:MAG: DUF559 domain-containing protein [Herbiconiux sp.]|nr:DUF559 domain-containing protein [Herbiconiux sp.]